jgi:cytochrome b561
MLRKITLGVLTLTLLLIPVSGLAVTPELGQTAPAFSLFTPDGHSLSLSEFIKKGTVVLVGVAWISWLSMSLLRASGA